MGLISNTKWVGFSQGFKIIVQLLNIVVLARMIPPQEYGLMAMALVVVNLATLVRDLGTSAAIIQRKELQDKTINAVFWLNIFMGLGVCLVVVLISPVVSSFFNQDKLVLILCLLSLSFPLGSSSAAHLALLERQSQFKKVAFIEITSSLFSFVVAVTLAVMGYGVMSLVAQVIVLNLMSTIQLWLASSWRPSFAHIWDKAELKSIFGFSANLTAFNFINYFSRNADSMIIGHYFSSLILGAYSLAYRIMLFPLQSLTFVASRALFPVLSRYQDEPEKIREVYYNVLYYILLLVVPLMMGIAILSKEFVLIVFGDKWALTATILVWLAPTAIIQSILSTSGTLFMSKGRTDTLMILGLLGAILQVSAFMIGSRYDIVTFSQLYFIANILNFIPVIVCVRSLIGFSLIAFFKRILPILVSGALMVGLVYWIKTALGHALSTEWVLAISILCGMASYTVAILLVDKSLRMTIAGIVRRKKKALI
ncbi:MOP flippase family protein [Lonsdalea quercina]|uniref:MOP flippase family protein n=1 Tax=Lonsdalea quercina TaxID=71657 RepID=UPI003F445A81